MTAHHARRLAREHTSSIILEHYADCPRRVHIYLCVQGIIVHGDLSSWNILLASATEEEEEESDNIGFVAKVGPCCCGVR